MKNFLRSFLPFVCGGVLMLTLVSWQMSPSLSDENTSGSLGEALFPNALAGFGTNELDPFAGYASWPSSATLKAVDHTAQVLNLLSSSPQLFQLIDFNGDGLIDMLYRQSNSAQINVGIFLNNGDGFADTYQCTYRIDTQIYYGDCAG